MRNNVYINISRKDKHRMEKEPLGQEETEIHLMHWESQSYRGWKMAFASVAR
jgi:hypothetical protein